jgi:hypothetical protein
MRGVVGGSGLGRVLVSCSFVGYLAGGLDRSAGAGGD